MDANRNTLEAGHRNGNEAFCEREVVARAWDFGDLGWWRAGGRWETREMLTV